MKNGKLFKFLLYLIAIVLINIVGLTLFKRWDLTQNRLYAISEVSQQVVRDLAEPLTINAFFTKDLPAPHNATERYLRDLLEEYALHANKNFNYRIHTIRADDGTLNNTDQNDIELAESYGIEPIQIQRIDADEIKFQRAYMGLVLIHGDMVEKIPAITTTDGLEYRITTAISKLNNKIGAFANLDEKGEHRSLLIVIAALGSAVDAIRGAGRSCQKYRNGGRPFKPGQLQPALFSEAGSLNRPPGSRTGGQRASAALEVGCHCRTEPAQRFGQRGPGGTP